VKVLSHGFGDTCWSSSDTPGHRKLHRRVSIPRSSQAVNWVFFHGRESKNLFIFSEVRSNVFASLEKTRQDGLKAGCGGQKSACKGPTLGLWACPWPGRGQNL